MRLFGWFRSNLGHLQNTQWYSGAISADPANGRTVEYTHRQQPGRQPSDLGILKVIDAAGSAEFEFFDTHVNGSDERKLEEIIGYHSHGDERIRKYVDNDGTECFEYRDPQGNVVNLKAHDPVEIGGRLKPAQKRYNDLTTLYRQLLNQVTQEVAKEVPTNL